MCSLTGSESPRTPGGRMASPAGALWRCLTGPGLTLSSKALLEVTGAIRMLSTLGMLDQERLLVCLCPLATRTEKFHRLSIGQLYRRLTAGYLAKRIVVLAENKCRLQKTANCKDKKSYIGKDKKWQHQSPPTRK